MNPTDIKSIRFDMWVDDEEIGGTSSLTGKPFIRERNVCSFHIQRQDPAGGTGMDRYHPSRSEARKEFGLGFVSFYMDGPELHRLTAETSLHLKDGYHNLSKCGDFVTFFDLEIQYRLSNGTMEVPFLTLELPRRFWMYLERVARYVWAQQRKANEANKETRYYSKGQRVEFTIPLKTLERFQRQYGQGKGKVDLQLTPRLQEKMKTSQQVRECVERVQAIARNTTRSIYSTSRASFVDDRGDFYWAAFNPHGNRIMNGGINCHMNGDEESWSINT